MRTLIFLTALFLTALPLKIFSSGTDTVVYENDSVFTIQDYQEELKEDGEWIKVNKEDIDPDGVTEGTDELDDNLNTDYVWRPNNVDENWSPYTNGYWQYTNCGWMWVSYYTWGWRTCHYGRWWWSPVWGWVWSPGFVWAPSWVVWMFSGEYCGWYPISPRVRWHRHHGYRCHHMRFHKRRWAFCHTHNMHNPITPRIVIDPMYNGEIINKTKFVSNVGVAPEKVTNPGPSLTEVEKYSEKKYQVSDVMKYNNTEKFKEYKDAGKKDDFGTNDKEYKNNEKKVKNDNNNSTKEPTKNSEKKQENSTKEPPKNNEKKSPDVNRDKQDNSTKESPKNNNEKKEYNSPPKQKDDSQKKNDSPPPVKQKEESKPKNESPPQKKEESSKDKGKGN